MSAPSSDSATALADISPPAIESAAGPPTPLWRLFLRYYTRARDRRHLQELDERMLRDIGLTPENLQRPLWFPWDRP